MITWNQVFRSIFTSSIKQSCVVAYESQKLFNAYQKLLKLIKKLSAYQKNINATMKHVYKTCTQ